MEKFFNFSITTFRNSISSALPYILVYSLTNILISFFIQFPELNEDLESSMGSFDENLFTYLVIIFLLRSIYDISILKLIICKIKKQKIIFNIASMLNYLFRVMFIDIFWIFIPIALALLFFAFLGSSMIDYFFVLIPIFYLITYFSKYLIIDENQGVIESILTSYYMIKSNFIDFTKLVSINILMLFIIFYTIVLIGSFFENLLTIIINIQFYFLTIFNVYFYFSLKSLNNEGTESE